MEAAVGELFERYQQMVARSLQGDVDLEATAAFFAAEYIAAAPAGVSTGKNDATLRQAMQQAYAHYREIGTKEMRIRNIRISPIDELHCTAHVAWSALYARPSGPDVTIAFDVHYLVQVQNGDPKIFGWITGDEQALLKQHGIV